MNAETKVRAGGVHRKLSAARKRFHSLRLRKSGKNTYAGYDYFELGDFIIPALEVFDEIGLCATVSFDREMATMTIVDTDSPHDRIVLTSPMGSAALKGCHEVQNIGAVETYQRRYLWITALEIVEHDALDRVTGKDDAPVARKKLDGPYASMTQLQRAAREFVRTLEGMGDLGEFMAWGQTPEVTEFLAQLKRDLPDWYEGGDSCPPEWVPIRIQIARRKRELEELDEIRTRENA